MLLGEGLAKHPVGYRLTAADYSSTSSEQRSTGDSCHYAYDSVGNRLTQDSSVHGLSSSVSYNYDIANRLADVDGVPYVYDANGNLLSDGQNTYAYDSANRLTSVIGPSSSSQFTYNGLDDRLSQDGVNYTLDLNAGLTQVLDDGTNTYTYGLGRISQQSGDTAEYFLGDALGSVRQLVNNGGEITLTNSYDPYGVVTQSTGNGQTNYGFTGETADSNGLVYLRARYYNPLQGRFFQQDPWDGDASIPATLNPYLYGFNNPLLYTDPSGENPLLAALMPALIGLGAGIAAGAVAGGTFGYAMYPWALSGKCGCEAQEQAKAAGDRWSYTGANALAGGLMGGYSVALAAATISTGAIGGIIVGGIGFVAFGVDFQKTRNIIKNETGYTACTVTRLLIDLVGMTLSGVGVFKSVQAWRASGSGLSLTPSTARLIASTQQDLEAAASRAASQVGEGSGSVYGTQVHTAFQNQVEALGRANLHTEVSYLNGEVVMRGRAGSVRLDVVLGSPENPMAIFDLKTGSAILTSERILNIRSHLPISAQNVPIIQIGPP